MTTPPGRKMAARNAETAADWLRHCSPGSFPVVIAQRGSLSGHETGPAAYVSFEQIAGGL